jgi:hypothetical protein
VGLQEYRGELHASVDLSHRSDRGHHGDTLILRVALMTISESVEAIVAPEGIVAPEYTSYVSWTPVVLGALVAAAFSSILLAFGATMGLAVTSAAPTWRDASAALALLSGLYLIIQAAVSFGAGGYIAGRIRAGVADVDPVEAEQRDGLHGLAAWATAVVLGALLAALIGSAGLTRPNAPAATTSAAEPLLSYEIDRMFRAVRRPPNVDLAAGRAEAGRILLTASSHSGMSNEDRGYLVQLVSTATGLTGPDAERRVDTAVAGARKAIANSRRSSVILAFSVAAALLLGAAISWAMACAGGRYRNGEPMPRWLGATTTRS